MHDERQRHCPGTARETITPAYARGALATPVRDRNPPA